MKITQAAATIAALVLATACSTTEPAAPRPSATAAARYLGAIKTATVYDTYAHLAPPAPGTRPKLTWQEAYGSICGKGACRGRPTPDVWLAHAEYRWRKADAMTNAMHGQLTYVFRWNNDQCMPARGQGPVGRHCRYDEYVDATTGRELGIIGGPMPGQ